MPTPPAHIRLVRILGIMLFLVATPWANADPPSINSLITRNDLSTDDRGKISTFAAYWSRELAGATDDTAEIKRIRTQLTAPLTRGGISEVFRAHYGGELVRNLEAPIRDGNGQVAVNAIIVLSLSGTEKALEALVERTSTLDEPRRHVRLASARGCVQLFERRLATMKPNKITTASRRLSAAASNETDPLTLRYLSLALLAAEQTEQIRNNDDARADVRGYILDALRRTADRVAAASPEDDPVGLLTAPYPMLSDLREAFLALPPGPQKSFGRQLGPCIRQLLDAAGVHWDIARARGERGGQPGNMIYLCENFLSTIDTFVRGASPPDTSLKEAWDRGDIARYRADLGRWQVVLSNPPY